MFWDAFEYKEVNGIFDEVKGKVSNIFRKG